MTWKRGVSVALLVLVAVLASGCRTYEVWQADHWRRPDYQPANTKRAAVVMFAPWSEIDGKKVETHGTGQTLHRNKTFAEAMIICLQQRGVRIVEQQVVEVAQREARLTLSKQTDVVSTKDLAARLGKQLNLDTIFYADSTGRRTYYEFFGKLFGANNSEAKMREGAANQRGGIVPEDARRCTIVVHHNVGLSVRAVDVATGRITWVGFRDLAIAEEYSSDHPEALSTFGAVQKLVGTLADDLLAGR